MITNTFTPVRPTVIVTPPSGLIDQPIQVEVRGAPPGQQASVRARLVDSHGTWTSHAIYICDAAGAFVADAGTLMSSLAIAGPGPHRTFDETSIAPLDVDFLAEINGQTVATAT